jgi:NAD(P)-dependent dehydrogenase (short-subunit alcohol dehydrogenase family)
MQRAVIIGNSDGIGLALTRRLLDLGWSVHGMSRSVSPVDHEAYSHTVVDVTDGAFSDRLSECIQSVPDLCVYCVGIGEPLNLDDLPQERTVFEVNLMAAVNVVETVLPALLERSAGHIIVLSSLADVLVSPEAPSYSASKAGLSSYLEGLALAVRDRGVAITNIRFGFVDTKMAKGERFPFMMTADRAAGHITRCIEKRPIRYSRPRIMALLVCIVRWLSRLKL